MDRLIQNADGGYGLFLPEVGHLTLAVCGWMRLLEWLGSCPAPAGALSLFELSAWPGDDSAAALGRACWHALPLGRITCSEAALRSARLPLSVFALKVGAHPVAVCPASRGAWHVLDSILRNGCPRITSSLTFGLLVPATGGERFDGWLRACGAAEDRWGVTGVPLPAEGGRGAAGWPASTPSAGG